MGWARYLEQKMIHTEMYERVRQAYQEGKSLNWISHEYHHTWRTIYKAIRSIQATAAGKQDRELTLL